MSVDKITYLEKETTESRALTEPGHPDDKPFGLERGHVLALIALLACFGLPLYRLIRFALGEDLYSYIVLLPFVSWYLIHLRPLTIRDDSKPMRGMGIFLVVAGGALAALYLVLGGPASSVATEDYLSVNMLAFFLCFLGVNGIFLRKGTFRAMAFPMGILVFMIPMPVVLRAGMQTFLQYGSADVAGWLFKMYGTTFLRDDLIFRLPGINLRVAPECSGIHSTWILLITSLIAGYLFLRSPWRRGWLTLFVLPLALLRNGFRVFVIGELCVHIGPQMIDSPIHHKGGPIFFALSLIPFFILLVWLRWSERPRKQVEPQT